MSEAQLFQNVTSNEIDLKNYYPHKLTYDSVIYVHKRFLKGKQEQVASDKVVNVDSVSKEGKRCVAENVQREHSCKTYDKEVINLGSSDPILQKTIEFAKNIAPLAMPSSQEKVPVYTIKTCKKHRKKNKNSPEPSTNRAREKCMMDKFEKKMDTYRTEKRKCRDNLVLREAMSQTSQSNTLDEININQSLTCSSSMSENIPRKKCNQSRNTNLMDMKKIAVSESFEALATELMDGSGDNKIKIHLMKDTDKRLFREDIKGPIVSAIKEYLQELINKTENNDDLTNVQKMVKRNTQVLDNILEKLENIERKIDNICKDNIIVTKTCKPKPVKPSILESLEDDIFDANTKLEEVHRPQSAENRRASNNTVVILSPIKEKREKSGDGEAVIHFVDDADEVTPKTSRTTLLGDKLKSTSNVHLGSKPERPNRIPARFCWTDAGKRQ